MVVANCRLADEVIRCSPLFTDGTFIDEHDIRVAVHGDDSMQHIKKIREIPQFGMSNRTPFDDREENTTIATLDNVEVTPFQ